jgi:hypothetical protein
LSYAGNPPLTMALVLAKLETYVEIFHLHKISR